MSNISNRHSFVTFKSTGSDKSKALSGQRLSVVRFKTTKAGTKAKDSQCVSVPMLQATPEQLVTIDTHVQSWLRGVQDEIIRAACVADSAAVTDEEISFDAIAKYLAAQAAGERLTGEVINEWFDSELSDVLLLAFAEKLGISDSPSEEETKKLSQMVTVYRDCFAAMAGGRTMFDASKRAKLQKALSLCDCTSGVGEKLATKLEAMSKVSVEEMLGL
jgi:hypothetical protein